MPESAEVKAKKKRQPKRDRTTSVPGRAKGSWWHKVNPAHPDYDPVLAEKHRELSRRGGAAGTSMGVPAGWSRRFWDARFDLGKKTAAKIVNFMEEQGMVETPDGLTAEEKAFGTEALVTAVAVMRESEITPKDRLTAAKIVLEWTKQKPATKSDVKISAAEEFLNSVADQAGI